MKIQHLVLAGIVAVCAVAQADVYSNVYFWSRGLGDDLNGNGALDANEGRDSLNRTKFDYTVKNSGTTGEQPPISYTNEWAHLPYRGTTNFVRSVYFPQNVVITNDNPVDAGVVGYGYPTSVSIPNSAIPAMTRQDVANYTVYLRFRPDLNQPHPNYSWLFNFGHDGNVTPKRGLMIGFAGKVTNEHSYGGTTRTYYTNYTATVNIYYGGRNWNPNSNQLRVNLGNWNDLIISCDGTKMRCLFSRDCYIDGFENNYNNSSVGHWPTFYGETTIHEGYDLRPNGTHTGILLGTESACTMRQAYKYPAADNGNQWKAFRGSIQTIALWTNALSEAQMREALGWPRTDKWRLGVEDGKADEFGTDAAPAESASVNVDDDVWNVPPLAANGSLTVNFPLNASGDAKMNQFVRIKGAPGSANVSLKVAVNGTFCEGSKIVQPGHFTRWFVPAGLLRANATNTLVVTRTDPGSTPFRMDVAAFGGSLQYCEENGNTFENHGEGKSQDSIHYNLAGGNWFDGNRAIFGGVRGEDGIGREYTNQVIRFSLPTDLQPLKHDYRLTLRTANYNHAFDLYFNDAKLIEGMTAFGEQGVSVDVPGTLFRDVNEINFVNVTDYIEGKYTGIDFMRLSVQKPATGTIMLLR